MIRPYKILLAEADEDLASITKNYLVEQGYPTRICYDAESVKTCIRKEKIDFLIIDVSFSAINGFDLLIDIRKTNRFLPVILLGNNVLQSDIIKGFHLGADDFVTRPFSIEELGLRIEAIKRRMQSQELSRHVYHIGRYTFDTLRHVLIYKGEEKKLTTKELDLLFLFCEYKNRVVERQLALKKVWNQDNYFSARNMDVYIKRIRDLLSRDPDIKLENVHGVGYKLVIPSN